MAHTPVEERRKALIAATLRVISARGLSSASTRTIVAEAGMSLASFHYAFTSRDELIDVLITEVLAKEEKAIAPAELVGRSLTELLTEGLSGYLAHLRSDPSREQAMLELTQHALRERPELARQQYAEYTRMAVAMLELAATHTGHEWSVPVPVAARLLLTMTDGLTMTWLVDRDDALAEDVVRAAAQAVASLAHPAA
ncbi:TetR/AcrR family transcriptional regulator [Microbacterium sp. H1-D42]|uniref:TetR/AcrR family transcriptional regulator n=1 Tax=Microbacterium sp. H1-D42 TaxID=2925844 RepID=UPI001F530234|nr:TetR/AcrR family transcriptional regulator [Microbacterium sp. H1-D42]UNK71097.1 TetR/AcrR family transcriptional regulator [Microbacterium sp. H1-D42]